MKNIKHTSKLEEKTHVALCQPLCLHDTSFVNTSNNYPRNRCFKHKIKVTSKYFKFYSKTILTSFKIRLLDLF